MWPLAGYISSTLVRTPSLQLGVLQSLQGSFHSSLILSPHLACSYPWWKPGRTHTSLSPSISRPKSGKREWTPLHQDHLNRALYICHYLLGTLEYALVFDGKSNEGLIAYADSDWASDPITRKSTTGYLVESANGTFCWNSRAQKSIALSSTEAKYMSLSDMSRQVVWIHSLFKKIGINLGPIPLCRDNQGSIFIASNPVQEKQIKHIDLRYHYIREVIHQKQIELLFIEGAENPADLFTKNLGHIKFPQIPGTTWAWVLLILRPGSTRILWVKPIVLEDMDWAWSIDKTESSLQDLCPSSQALGCRALSDSHNP